MSASFKIFVSLFFVIFISTVNGTEHSESDLRRVLLENYDKLVRPARKTTDAVPVRINLNPTRVRDVDVKDREIKFDSWLAIRWQDPHLTWDAAEYGTSQLILPVDQLWIPDISIYTTVSDDRLLPEKRTNVVVFNNGTVIWVPFLTVKSRCIPTEDQISENTFQCTVKLGSWTYHIGFLDLHHDTDDPLARAIAEESFFNLHPKWILESMTASTEAKKYACCEELYPTVSYDMRFRKRQDTDQ